MSSYCVMLDCIRHSYISSGIWIQTSMHKNMVKYVSSEPEFPLVVVLRAVDARLFSMVIATAKINPDISKLQIRVARAIVLIGLFNYHDCKEWKERTSSHNRYHLPSFME